MTNDPNDAFDMVDDHPILSIVPPAPEPNPNGTWPRWRLSDLLAYVPNPADHIAGRGWLRRGAGTLLTGGTGLGKSILAQQLGTCVASGTDFFGIRISNPYRVMIVEAENDIETLARDFAGIVAHAPGLPEKGQEGQDLIEKNLSIYHAFGIRGEQFTSWLHQMAQTNFPDLIIIDPYQSFVDAADFNATTTFLSWITPIETMLRTFNCALLLVCHTPKPKDRDSWTARESVYMAAGSAVLSNWARCSAELTEESDGERFRLRFGKNAERTDLVDENDHTIRDIYIRHGERLAPSWQLARNQDVKKVTSKHTAAVLQARRDNPRMTIREIAKLAGCCKSTASDILSEYTEDFDSP